MREHVGTTEMVCNITSTTGGFMADLDDKWIWLEGPECPPDKPNSPQRLGLANLEGIFIMIVGGVVAGTVLIVIELVYKKYRARYAMRRAKIKEEKESISRNLRKEFGRVPVAEAFMRSRPGDDELRMGSASAAAIVSLLLVFANNFFFFF